MGSSSFEIGSCTPASVPARQPGGSVVAAGWFARVLRKGLNGNNLRGPSYLSNIFLSIVTSLVIS